MPVRRKRKAAAVLPTRPPMPIRLCIYSPADWGAPDIDPIEMGWDRWEEAHRLAYAAHLEAAKAWRNEFGQLPVGEVKVLDEAWSGSFEESCCNAAPLLDS